MPYQANSEAACGANASALGPNAVVPPFPFRFLLQLLSAVSGHFTSRHRPASSRTHLVIRVPHPRRDKSSSLNPDFWVNGLKISPIAVIIVTN